MEPKFKRVLIACDFSPMDDKLMNFIKAFKSYSDVQKVYLLHVIPDFTNPTNKDLEFHKLFSSGYPVDEKVRDFLTEKAAEIFDDSIEVSIDVIEGRPYQKLIQWAEHKEVDLVVIGRKEKSSHSGITSNRVLRNVRSNVLLFPENASADFKNVLVPVDFSSFSARALATAIDIRRRSGEQVSITALHIIQMLMTDHYYGLVLNPRFQEMLNETAEKSFDDFVNKHKFNAQVFERELVLNLNNNAATHIGQYLEANQNDLVVMGAKGHSLLERFLVGSTTEQLVNNHSKTPFLILR